MMKIQTKLAVAFMGSAFLAFVIWDRGTKKTELDVGPIEDHVQQKAYDSDRVIHRSKRQAVGRRLDVIYRQFENLSPCCSVPNLITTDALDACEANYVKRKGNSRKKSKQRPQASRNLFTSISDMFTRQNSRKASIQRQGGKQSGGRIVKAGGRSQKINKGQNRGKRQTSAQKITLQSVGYTDCVFNYKNYLNDSALDLNMIEDNFVGRVKDHWKPVVQDAMYMCEEPAACASPEMINVGGRFCSIKPTILMICMRRQMLLNCPSESRTGRDYKCNSGMASLKSMNTHNLAG